MLAADLSALPFEDDAFDVVVCIRLFHLIPEPGLREVFFARIKTGCQTWSNLWLASRSKF